MTLSNLEQYMDIAQEVQEALDAKKRLSLTLNQYQKALTIKNPKKYVIREKL